MFTLAQQTGSSCVQEYKDHSACTVSDIEHLVSAIQVDERLGAVQDLEARLKQSQEMADVFTNRERIFDLPASAFPALAGMHLSLHDYQSQPGHHVFACILCHFNGPSLILH